MAKDGKIRQKTTKYGKTTKYDKRQQTALVSVSVFFPTITIFPSLLIPYHARVSKRSATPVLLDCLCMDFCMEYIYVKLSALDDKICVPVIKFLCRVGLVMF